MMSKPETCPTCGLGWGHPRAIFCSNSWHLANPLIAKQVSRQQKEIFELKYAAEKFIAILSDSRNTIYMSDIDELWFKNFTEYFIKEYLSQNL